jgi:hypothetical protein
MKEAYKIIKNYEVSTLGNIRNIKTGKILKGELNSGGYLHVNLSRKTMTVHRLVALAFIENPMNKKLTSEQITE